MRLRGRDGLLNSAVVPIRGMSSWYARTRMRGQEASRGSWPVPRGGARRATLGRVAVFYLPSKCLILRSFGGRCPSAVVRRSRTDRVRYAQSIALFRKAHFNVPVIGRDWRARKFVFLQRLPYARIHSSVVVYVEPHNATIFSNYYNE